MNPEKTTPDLTGGQLCTPERAFEQFIATKRIYDKAVGRQYIHFTQSFKASDKMTPELAREIAERLLQLPDFQGFQVVYATHTDKAHIHTHFVVNSVNMEGGLKWSLAKDRLQALKDYSNRICREYALHVISEDKPKLQRNSEEYRAESKGQSWKHELFLAAAYCLRCSCSQAEFIASLEKLGYQVKWTEQDKYVTFTTPCGKKCRNKKLYPPERFSKDAMLKRFALNAQRFEESEKKKSAITAQARIGLLLEAVMRLSMGQHSDAEKKLPLSTLEGQALKDKFKELELGQGFDWKDEVSI